MMNSIGLQNIGVRAFAKEKLPALARLRTAVFANVFGYDTADYVEVVRVLEDHPGIAGYELNVSCPNTKHGGIYFSSDPALLGEVVSAREAGGAPVGQALPQCRRDRPLARAAEESGADALSMVNTLSRWPSTRVHESRASARALAASRGRPSSRSRCEWCSRRPAP